MIALMGEVEFVEQLDDVNFGGFEVHGLSWKWANEQETQYFRRQKVRHVARRYADAFARAHLRPANEKEVVGTVERRFLTKDGAQACHRNIARAALGAVILSCPFDRDG